MTAANGFLTTHVLDTARGVPAAGLQIELLAIADEKSELLAAMTTNSDGRTDSPILPADRFRVGTFELRFHAGRYLDRHFADLPEPRFLDVVPIRFGIGDANAHYHVPLLLSPFGYSTYRGS